MRIPKIQIKTDPTTMKRGAYVRQTIVATQANH